MIADLRRVPELATPSGAASLYGIWHGALAFFALGGALVPARHHLRRALMLAVAVFDLLYGLPAETWLESIWHNGASLRAAQFIVPAAGLLADNARLVGLLHRHERGLDRQLARAAELAERAGERPASDAGADERIRAVLATEDFHPVFQPIVTLETGEILAVQALTRFTARPHRTPDRWFDEAHAVGRGVELELATLRVALAGSMLIAEGVEHAAELDVLRALGVPAAQGYLLCRPVPVDELPTRSGLAPDPVGSRP